MSALHLLQFCPGEARHGHSKQTRSGRGASSVGRAWNSNRCRVPRLPLAAPRGSFSHSGLTFDDIIPKAGQTRHSRTTIVPNNSCDTLQISFQRSKPSRRVKGAPKIMARLSHALGVTPSSNPERGTAELNQLLARLEHTILRADQDRERRLRSSEYERARLNKVCPPTRLATRTCRLT